MSLIEGAFETSSVDWESWDVGDISLNGLDSVLIINVFSCSWRITVGNGVLPISSLSRRY